MCNCKWAEDEDLQGCPLNVKLGGSRGESMDINFSDTPVTVPILSMRKHIHRGCRCRIQNGGGYFRDTKTGRKQRFIEKGGVYFMKMRVSNQGLPPLAKGHPDVREACAA